MKRRVYQGYRISSFIYTCAKIGKFSIGRKKSCEKFLWFFKFTGDTERLFSIVTKRLKKNIHGVKMLAEWKKR